VLKLHTTAGKSGCNTWNTETTLRQSMVDEKNNVSSTLGFPREQEQQSRQLPEINDLRRKSIGRPVDRSDGEFVSGRRA